MTLHTNLANWIKQNHLKLLLAFSFLLILFLFNLPTIDRYKDPRPAIQDTINFIAPVAHADPLPVPHYKKLHKLPLKHIKPKIRPLGSGGLNLYPGCQCTWGAKNLRPDLPNHMGNGGEWYDTAINLGLPHGLIPRLHAVGSTWNTAPGYGHVGVVIGIKGNQVQIKEMNVLGCFYSTAWYPASYWRYIY